MNDEPPTGDHERPIAETMRAEVLGAAIDSRDRVSLTIRVAGQFRRPGSEVEVPPILIVTTVPATVLPR